ncbi:MAG: hypothetical protein ACKVOU_12875 [Cytophagales bacterium]
MTPEINTNQDVAKQKLVKNHSNPFPGLRPFSMDESHLFFGREGQSDEVLRKISENKFVAVIGSSGSGKSSFIYCGVIPILYGGFLTKIGTNWDVIVTRPGGGPIDNLAESIAKKDKNYSSLTREEKTLQKTITSTLLRSSSLGITEAVSKYTETENTNILLIVDQFEELFRFKKNEENEGSSESLAYVNLLVDAVQNAGNHIYVAATMRSDFIGECAQFPQLTRLINQSNYLIPQMTREQKRSAIFGPVSVGGAKITPRLLQQILGDLGDNPDQLPIMAHSLMRTWDYWQTNKEDNEPMDLPHYEAIGTMSGALSQHANEAYDELNAREKEICAILFKCLTEKTGDSDGIRRPTRVNVISKIANCTDDEIINIVEVFRKPGRSLIMPPFGVNLSPNSIVDISHESLMRIWVRLKNWVDEEGQAVEMYLRLSDAASKYQTGKSGMWRPPDLQLALNWQEKNIPTLEWAVRYNPAYERTMVFLETSKKAFETEQKVKEEQQRKRLAQATRTALFLGVLTVLALVAFVYSFILKIEADKQTGLAKESQLQAIKQSKLATKNAKLAEEQRIIASAKEKEAVLQSEEAKHQKELALVAADEANLQKSFAQKSLVRANVQTKIAEEQKALALLNEQKAKDSQIKAERAQTDASRQRFLSIAQAMSVKSLQILDTTTKVLVAQQAFKYNRDFKGNPHSHDVYDGLYYATKFLFHDNHNSLKGHSDAVRGVVFAPNGDLYTAGSDGKVLKWSMENGIYKSVLFHKNSFINRNIIISSNGKWLALVGEAPFIQLFDLSNPNSKPKKLYGHKGQIWTATFMPDNQNLVSIGSDSSILMRNLDTDKYFLVAKTSTKVKTLATSSVGNYIAGGDEIGNIFVWDVGKTKAPMVITSKNLKKIQSLSISLDGKYLAAGDEHGLVKIWDAFDNFKLTANLTGHRSRINDLKFDPKSEVLATASFDGSVRMWDLDHLNEQPITLRDHNSWVWSVAFTGDGLNIVTGCVDNLIRIYPTNAESMADKICSKLKRNMTPAEWTAYVAKDISFEETCPGLPQGRNQELE